MTIEVLQQLKAIDRIANAARELRQAARERSSKIETGRNWYERELRNKGRAAAYRHAAEMLETIKRELES